MFIRQLAGGLSGLTAGLGLAVLLVFWRLKVKKPAVIGSAVFTLGWVILNVIVFMSIFMSVALRSHIPVFALAWVLAQVMGFVGMLLKIRAWRNYDRGEVT